MVHSGRLDVLIPGFHWRGWIFPAGAGLLLSWVMLTRHSDTGHKLLCWTRRQSANSPLFSYYFKDPWLLRNDPGSFTQQLTLSRVTSLLPVRMQHWEGNWLNFFFFVQCFWGAEIGGKCKALWSFSLNPFWQSIQTWRGVSLTSSWLPLEMSLVQGLSTEEMSGGQHR